MNEREHRTVDSNSADQGAKTDFGSGVPAGIRLLYESRDGEFCVFEDAQGHISCVRASRLA